MTITDDHENLYGKVDFNLEENIDVMMRKEMKLQSSVSKLSISELKEKLGKISPKLYEHGYRVLFFSIQFRLSQLGIAPYWRRTKRIEGVKARRSRSLTESEIRYANDCQMIDMEWVHRTYPNHKTDNQWQGMYKDLFRQKDFNLKQANIIACAEFKREQKIKGLRLNVDMQKQLFVLRTDKVRKVMDKLGEDREAVEEDLTTASQRNRRRGQKLRDNIDSRVSLWACTQIVENLSLTRMCETYQNMTGESIHPSTFKRKLESTNEALKEVNSPHSF